MIDKKGRNWSMEKGLEFEQEVYPIIVKQEALGLWGSKKDRDSFMRLFQCLQSKPKVKGGKNG